MKHSLYLFLFLFGVYFSWSQDPQRLIINGEINVVANDVEGISIYNTSTNKGVISNSKGEFAIEVGLNDKLEISALQFKKKTIVVDETILKNKSLKISLVENINALEEITLLPYELTGNISEDVETAKVLEPTVFTFGSFEDYEFSDDYKSKVENTVVTGRYRDGLNMVNVFTQLIKPLFKSKKTTKDPNVASSETTSLSNKYSSSFISKAFGVPEDEAGLFIEYVQNNGLTNELLENGNEMTLVAFLHEKSKLYLRDRSDKN